MQRDSKPPGLSSLLAIPAHLLAPVDVLGEPLGCIAPLLTVLGSGEVKVPQKMAAAALPRSRLSRWVQLP